MDSAEKCAVCQETCLHLESCDCKRVSYCSREHLKEDWGKHRERDCFPAIISPGRTGTGFLVTATRQLLEGQKIIREKPLVLVPLLRNSSAVDLTEALICLGCCRIIPQINDYTCSNCKWNVCSAECEQKKFHKMYECKTFAEKKILPKDCSNINSKQLYWNIAILRCLLSMQSEPENWKNMFTVKESLEILSQRIGSKSNRQIYTNAHEFVRETCGFSEFQESDSEKIYQILWVNSFEPTDAIMKEQVSHMRMLYKYSWGFLPSGCCIPNARWAVTDPNDPEEDDAYFVVRCTMHVNKDENIFVDSYGLEPLFNNPVGTFLRRAVLSKKYLRPCSCSRCSDPTEWETFLTAVKCRKEKCDGFLLPIKPLDMPLKWKCFQCKMILKHDTILTTVEVVANKLNDVRLTGLKRQALEQIKSILETIKFCEDNFVHKNHFLILSAIIYACEIFLAMFIAIFKPGACLFKENEALSVSVHLIPLVKRLYKIAHVLYPGKSQLRGKILLYLYVMSYSNIVINSTGSVDEKAKTKRFGVSIKEKLETILQCHDEVELLLNLEPVEYKAIDFITAMKKQILEDVFGSMEEALKLT